MKTKPQIIRTLNTGIFSAPVVLSVGFKYDELIKRIGKEWAAPLVYDKELIDSGSCFALRRTTIVKHGREEKACDYFYIIFTGGFRFTDEDMCILAHEIHHICTFLLRDLLDISKEYECVAYTHTHIMRQCLEEIRAAYKK